MDDDDLVERRVRGEQAWRGHFLDVRRDLIEQVDGHQATREYIVHPGAVLVLPVLPDGRLVIERQYRYPLQQVFVEFPAGKLDPGESPLATGIRELREEAGYTAREWTQLGLIHPLLSYSTEVIHVYLAEGLEHVGAALDEGEFLEVGAMSVADMLAAVERGEITDAKTVTALLLYARRVGHR